LKTIYNLSGEYGKLIQAADMQCPA